MKKFYFDKTSLKFQIVGQTIVCLLFTINYISKQQYSFIIPAVVLAFLVTLIFSLRFKG